MTKQILTVIGLAICALLLDGAAPQTAECRRCSRRACHSSDSCGSGGCVRVKFGRERRGVCASVD